MPVVDDSDQVLPLLSVGDAIDTPEGPGVLVDVQFNTAQYDGKWQLEPPSLVVELDDGQTIHTCLCVITLPGTTKGTRLIHQEFNRLWPPRTEGVPEGADMLIPEGEEDAVREGNETIERKANMRRYAEDQESGYQGWKNYETWNAALWINNDEGMYDYLQEELGRLREDEEDHDEIVYALAQLMEDHFETMYDDNAAGLVGPLADLLRAAMSEIDWREISQSFLEE
ncbi:hypothetical protein LCGC14_0468980 [marine sediment metagenome]|uniref:Uncharacterized protein n=1 Tax=marine sediment metagenome TaxID=412755 RepID=A0A0F9SVN4_9ZZZZ